MSFNRVVVQPPAELLVPERNSLLNFMQTVTSICAEAPDIASSPMMGSRSDPQSEPLNGTGPGPSMRAADDGKQPAAELPIAQLSGGNAPAPSPPSKRKCDLDSGQECERGSEYIALGTSNPRVILCDLQYKVNTAALEAHANTPEAGATWASPDETEIRSKMTEREYIRLFLNSKRMKRLPDGSGVCTFSYGYRTRAPGRRLSRKWWPALPGRVSLRDAARVEAAQLRPRRALYGMRRCRRFPPVPADALHQPFCTNGAGGASGRQDVSQAAGGTLLRGRSQDEANQKALSHDGQRWLMQRLAPPAQDPQKHSGSPPGGALRKGYGNRHGGVGDSRSRPRRHRVHREVLPNEVENATQRQEEKDRQECQTHVEKLPPPIAEVLLWLKPLSWS